MVDGGRAYLRRGGKDLKEIVELSVSMNTEDLRTLMKMMKKEDDDK